MTEGLRLEFMCVNKCLKLCIHICLFDKAGLNAIEILFASVCCHKYQNLIKKIKFYNQCLERIGLTVYPRSAAFLLNLNIYYIFYLYIIKTFRDFGL